jgi:putative ABC transport system ATP-binding protein
VDRPGDRHRSLRDCLKHAPASCPAASSSGRRRSLASQPTIICRRADGNLDSHTGFEILDYMRRAVRELGQTIVMVTHDPNAASFADRVIFLADGRIVDEMAEPSAERVLDRMKRFGE